MLKYLENFLYLLWRLPEPIRIWHFRLRNISLRMGWESRWTWWIWRGRGNELWFSLLNDRSDIREHGYSIVYLLTRSEHMYGIVLVNMWHNKPSWIWVEIYYRLAWKNFWPRSLSYVANWPIYYSKLLIDWEFTSSCWLVCCIEIVNTFTRFCMRVSRLAVVMRRFSIFFSIDASRLSWSLFAPCYR